MYFFEKLTQRQPIKYIDLFCGIGGFRIASEQFFKTKTINSQCVFSCDIDKDAQNTYQVNFGDQPQGDIKNIIANNIPDHDLLFAGFPCQPFSICGALKGFEDTRGTLFFEISRILKTKKPYAFVLENVKQLVGHQKGKTLNTIISILKELGYFVTYKVLNALDFGLPQKRERIFIVGCLDPLLFRWESQKIPFKPLDEILEDQVSSAYYASEQIQKNRLDKYTGISYNEPMIWHENKAGHISVYPYSCAMRAGASYNYLLVDGKRRLTEREMLRLQGFPDSFKVVTSYTATKKLVGNSVAIPCVVSVLNSLFNGIEIFNQTHSLNSQDGISYENPIQLSLF
jgi:DNA (cytosine-5)-methyltransferase 1